MSQENEKTDGTVVSGTPEPIDTDAMVASLRAVGLGTTVSLEPHAGISIGLSESDVAGVDLSAALFHGHVPTGIEGGSIFQFAHLAPPQPKSYTPDPRSVEGRVDKMEEILGKLLAVVLEGETKQKRDIDNAAMGVMSLTANPDKTYTQRLQELLTEFKTHLEEVKASPRYRKFFGEWPAFW